MLMGSFFELSGYLIVVLGICLINLWVFWICGCKLCGEIFCLKLLRRF